MPSFEEFSRLSGVSLCDHFSVIPIEAVIMLNGVRKHEGQRVTSALRSLTTDDKIVIMSADKGGATVIMDKVDYVNKANQIFDDREAFSPLAADPTKKQAATIKKKVNELARLKLINPDDSRSMTLNDPRIALDVPLYVEEDDRSPTAVSSATPGYFQIRFDGLLHKLSTLGIWDDRSG
nr:unnamed protein product [Spirometra erinaceieuropaei]